MAGAPVSSAGAAVQGHLDGRLHSHPDVRLTLFTEFDVDAYARDALGRIPVDKDVVDELGPSERADLAFLWRLESSALSETRTLLATWTSNEARITAFVATWSFERLWLAHAVRDLLTANGEPLPEPAQRSSWRARLRDFHVQRVQPLVAPVWTNVVGEAVTAGHMARLALQEEALQLSFEAMLPRLTGEAHRVVAEIVARKERMIEFFTLEAVARIRRSRAEWLMARIHLAPGWEPLRVVGVADPDEAAATTSIFRTLDLRRRRRGLGAPIREALSQPHQPAAEQQAQVRAGLLSRRSRHGLRP